MVAFWGQKCTLLQNGFSGGVAKAVLAQHCVSHCLATAHVSFARPSSRDPYQRKVGKLHIKQGQMNCAAGVVKNCLMVLTHLILNDMMKVRSHISQLALRLQDDEPRIAALAQLFFHELSRKAFKVPTPPPATHTQTQTKKTAAVACNQAFRLDNGSLLLVSVLSRCEAQLCRLIGWRSCAGRSASRRVTLLFPRSAEPGCKFEQ